MTDRSVDRASKSVLSRKGNLTDANDLRDQFTSRLIGDRSQLGDAGRLPGCKQSIGAREDLVRLDIVASDRANDSFGREQFVSAQGNAGNGHAKQVVERCDLGVVRD